MLALTFAHPNDAEPSVAQEQVRMDAQVSAFGVLLGAGAIVLVTVVISTLVFGVYGYSLFLKLALPDRNRRRLSCE